MKCNTFLLPFLFNVRIIKDIYSFQEVPNYAIVCLICSHVSFALLMKSLYVFLPNNLLWLYTPNRLANMYKQMLLAFPSFYHLVLFIKIIFIDTYGCTSFILVWYSIAIKYSANKTKTV